MSDWLSGIGHAIDAYFDSGDQALAANASSSPAGANAFGLGTTGNALAVDAAAWASGAALWDETLAAGRGIAAFGADLAGFLTPAAGAIAGGIASALWSPALNENEVVPDVASFVSTPSSGIAMPQPPHHDDTSAWNTWLPAFDAGPQATAFPADAPVGTLAHIFPVGDVASWTRYETPVHAPDTSPYLSSSHDDWPLRGKVAWDQVGDYLGKGLVKSVHRLGDDQAIGVMKVTGLHDGAIPGSSFVIDELTSLKRLQGFDLPTVKASGPWIIGDVGQSGSTAGIVYDKVYEIGSKDFAVRNDAGMMIGAAYQPSPLLNEHTLEDLLTMRDIIGDRNLAIRDFQVLVDSDGHADIADPSGVFEDDLQFERPEKWYTLKASTDDHLNALIQAARLSVGVFGK